MGRERERKRVREGGKQKEVSLLGRLLQLLNVQLTDLVISVYSINGVTEYLMEEWQSNNLHVHVHVHNIHEKLSRFIFCYQSQT